MITELSSLKSLKALKSSHQRCSMQKDVLRNFTKSTGKHLCQSLFFNKVAGLRPANWHTGKVGPETLRWDPGPRILRWDPQVGPQGGTLGWDPRVGPYGGSLKKESGGLVLSMKINCKFISYLPPLHNRNKKKRKVK